MNNYKISPSKIMKLVALGDSFVMDGKTLDEESFGRFLDLLEATAHKDYKVGDD